LNNDKIEELSKRTVQLFEKTKNSVIYMQQKEKCYIAILLKEKI
jgi:hypothetical protein